MNKTKETDTDEDCHEKANLLFSLTEMKTHILFCALTTATAKRFRHINRAIPTRAEMIDVM
jgi:hypothetical protein